MSGAPMRARRVPGRLHEASAARSAAAPDVLARPPTGGNGKGEVPRPPAKPRYQLKSVICPKSTSEQISTPSTRAVRP